MPDYDIVEAFERIEKELMESMIRNLDHHRAMETDEGFEWSQWQVEQLKALENYKKKNKKKYGTQFKDINKQLGALIYLARSQGNMDQEIKILEAIKNGFTDYHKPSKKTAATDAAFFRVNDKKIDALIEATTKDFEKAEYAMLRRANDQYRKVIYNAQVYANAGGTTYEKAVDMAVQDYLKAGINCIEYSNGSRHTMKDYADMCIQTTTKRAYLTGEGEKRKEWGISLVIMNKRGNPCPKCLPFVGKIMVDDVWSGGKADGKHMLMSTAIAAGLYHPRCKDSHTTYFEGINTKGAPYTKKEKRQVIEDYNQEQKINQAKRQAEQQQRMADMMLDNKDKKLHENRAEKWKSQYDDLKSHNKENDLEDFNISSIKKTIDEKKKILHDLKNDFAPVTLAQLPTEHKWNVKDIIKNAPDDAKKIINEYYDDINIISFNPYKGKAHYSRKDKAIRINIEKAASDERGAYTPLFHEIGHNIDHLLGDISHTRNFGEILRKDFDDIVKEYMKVYNCDIDTAYSDIGKSIYGPENHSVSDLISGMIDEKYLFGYRHEPNYWNKPYKLEHEAFAHFFEAFIRNDTMKMEKLSQMFPKTMDAFTEMLKEV